jgi:hypothetical protein
MKSKKAQLQSGETIVVIIIVIIMLVVGIVFFTNRKMEGAKAESENLKTIDSMKITVVASSLSELKCSEYSTMVKTCFDYYRLKAFAGTVDADSQGARAYYYSILRNSRVDVKVIMPNSTVENITLYDYNNSANKSSSITFIPVIVSNPLNGEKYFSVLEVRTFS